MQELPQTINAKHDYRIPHFIAESLEQVDFKRLSSLGIDTLILDVDNTIVSYGKNDLSPALSNYLISQRENGYFHKLILATNATRDLGPIISVLKPDAVFQRQGLVMKPFSTFYSRILKSLEVKPEQTVMIGDRLIQDIWGARKVGMQSVLVEPLGKDLWADKIILTRWLERKILRRYVPKGIFSWFK